MGDNDDVFYLFLQKQKLALEPYTLPPGTPGEPGLCVIGMSEHELWNPPRFPYHALECGEVS